MFEDNPDLGQVREKYRVPLEKGEAIAERVRLDLEPLSDAMVLVGSIRRRRSAVADVEFVILPKDHDEFDAAVRGIGFEAGGKKRKYTGVLDGVKVELYVARSTKELGAMILTYTGDYLFNIALRSKAKRMGYKLDQYGIWKGKKAVLQSPDEREFFDFLGTEWHEPEERSLARRQELRAMGRRLLKEDIEPGPARFVERSMETLRTKTPLSVEDEEALESLYRARFGVKAVLKGASLGAEELIELGIMAADGLFEEEEEEFVDDPLGPWQRFYEEMTGGAGQFEGAVIRPVRENVFQIWARVLEEGRSAYYLVYHGEFSEETIGAPPEEVLKGFITWAMESGEAPPWLGPSENLPGAS